MKEDQAPPGPNLTRCGWCNGDDLYEQYHDEEWGVPVVGDQALFERLILEGMQAGLSWLTILKKRAHMQSLFFEFDIHCLAQASEQDVESWLQDPGIIRHRGKLNAMVGNAVLARDMPDFSRWLWQFAPCAVRSDEQRSQVPSETDESRAMSKALKKAGFRFVGPTICYAFMQSVGMVNDHARECFRYSECEALVVSMRGDESD